MRQQPCRLHDEPLTSEIRLAGVTPGTAGSPTRWQWRRNSDRATRWSGRPTAPRRRGRSRRRSPRTRGGGPHGAAIRGRPAVPRRQRQERAGRRPQTRCPAPAERLTSAPAAFPLRTWRPAHPNVDSCISELGSGRRSRRSSSGWRASPCSPATCNKARCAGAPFDGVGRSLIFDSIKDAQVCYSDIQFLWLGRDIDKHVFPYVNGGITAGRHAHRRHGGVPGAERRADVARRDRFAHNDAEFLLALGAAAGPVRPAHGVDAGPAGAVAGAAVGGRARRWCSTPSTTGNCPWWRARSAPSTW